MCGVFFLVHDDLAHGPAGVGDTAVVVSGHSWPAAPALTLRRYEGDLCGSVDVVVRGRGERGRPESFGVCKVGPPVQDVGQTFLGHPQDQRGPRGAQPDGAFVHPLLPGTWGGHVGVEPKSQPQRQQLPISSNIYQPSPRAHLPHI